MFKSRPKLTDGKEKRAFAMKQYSAEDPNIPLKKDWSETWCTLPQPFDTVLNEVLNYEVRKDDVFVCTFIKCGTTWMQETAWLLLNNLDFEKSKQIAQTLRSPFIDFHGIIPTAPNPIEYSKTLSSPRLLKTHMPANLVPKQIWEQKTKVIYVARNCKDVVVSSYHFAKNLRLWSGDNIEDFVNDFINDDILYCNYWTHIIDFWKMRNEENIFFTTYEEMKRDLGSVVQRLCTFLGRPQLTAEELPKTLEYLSFGQMKVNDKTNITTALKEQITTAKEDFQFMRRGIVGSFKDELTPELQEKIDNWSKNYLAQHGLTEEDIFGKL
ncbi:sulfotransferase 1 family member D1-like [Musca vetustissima]|uniref:sulfotransferase 1 family member D1-like n=1 Tax=Musca vetustissima TaxID=27455 RepID=UPI002AB68517|nr:sulfotransferase 1 family member D1-like [Musca vetustissima]